MIARLRINPHFPANGLTIGGPDARASGRIYRLGHQMPQETPEKAEKAEKAERAERAERVERG
jgi:hypothetical protein